MTMNADAMLVDARELMGANIVDLMLRDIHQALVATVEVTKNLDADRFNGTEAGDSQGLSGGVIHISGQPADHLGVRRELLQQRSGF